MRNRDDDGNHITQLIRSAGPPPDDWRLARCQAISAHGAKLGDAFAYVAFTLRQYGKTRLADLSDHELERTWRHVMARRTA